MCKVKVESLKEMQREQKIVARKSGSGSVLMLGIDYFCKTFREFCL